MNGKSAAGTRALDTDRDVSNVLQDIVAAGYVAVGRYYSRNRAKRLAAAEAAAISAAGLQIFVVFEDRAAPPLNFNSGVHDANIALQQAAAVKQPAGTAIYFALDSELGNEALAGVREYFRGVSETIGRNYKLGVYADGLVCKALLDDGTCKYAWLSASRGFPGSTAFYRSRRWALAQDPRIDQYFHGLSIDINEINGDFGSFQSPPAAILAGAAAPARAFGAEASPEVTAAMGAELPLVGIQPQEKTFDAKRAAFYGTFVEAAYAMYHGDPNNLTPAQPANFPAGYQIIAWVQMQDFIIGSTGPKFYGFIAQSALDPTQFILAIRGTSNAVEWWDDLNAVVKIPFRVPGCGCVGAGFARIYDTLEVVERGGITGAAAARSLRPSGTFSNQVANLLRRHAPTTAAATSAGFGPGASVHIAAHSLGAALATLYTLENAHTDRIAHPLLCTFASPLVGDSTFAAAFNSLGLASWRIVNQPDIVPKLPPEILGFTHVDSEQLYSSTGKVQPSVSCWHALATYLSLLDATRQPDIHCQLPAQALQPVPAFAAAASGPAATSVSVPAGAGATVNITINIVDRQ